MMTYDAVVICRAVVPSVIDDEALASYFGEGEPIAFGEYVRWLINEESLPGLVADGFEILAVEQVARLHE